MSATKRWLIWLAIFAVFVGFLMAFKTILLPFVAGMAIGYFLDPLADRLEALRVPRPLAALIVLVLFLLLAVAVLLLILPALRAQIMGLSSVMPEYLQRLQDWLISTADVVQAQVPEQQLGRIRESMGALFSNAFSWIGTLLGSILGGSLAIFNLLSLLFVTPIIAFYMLRDWDRLVAQVDALLPRQHIETIREQARAVDNTLAGFVRGQSSVCLILGVGYAVALTAAGLEFGFAVGLLAGLVSFIPYVGSMFGLITSIGLAIVQFDEIWRILLVAAIFLGGQAIEGNILTPKLVGERVNLHPVWVIFALFAGGGLAGFVGMLMALPVAAVIGVLVRFSVSQYLESALYSPTDSRSADSRTEPS